MNFNFSFRPKSLILILFFTIISKFLFAQPSWSVNPVEFGGNMSYTAWVLVDGVSVGHEDDLLAAFHNGDCRGVVSPSYNANSDRWLFFLTVFGDTQGELISFSYYDSQQDVVIDLETTVTFIANHQYGSPLEPKATADVNTNLSEADLISYALPNQLDVVIEGDTVYVVRNPVHSVNNLIANFETSPGSLVKIGSNAQFSGISGNNFNTIVHYQITSGDGQTVKNYYVKLVYEKMRIVASVFIDGVETTNSLDEVFVYIDGVHLGGGTPVLNPSINKYRYAFDVFYFNHPNLVFTLDFSHRDGINYIENPLVPSIEFNSASDIGSQLNPLVLSNVLLTGNELISFSLNEQIGQTIFHQDTLILMVPSSVDKANLVPVFETSVGAIATVNNNVQYSGITPVDFNDVVNYRIFNQTRSDSSDYFVKAVYFDQTYISTVWIDDEENINLNDSLIAIVDGQQISKVTPILVPDLNKYRFELTAFNAFPTGITEFIYWDAVSGTSHNLTPTYPFQHGSVLGTQYDPLYLSNVQMTGHEFIRFELPNQANPTVIYNDTIVLRPEVGATITELYPIFEVPAGAKVYTNDSIQYSEHTAVDLSSPLVYSVFNWEKNDSSQYVVAVQQYQMDLDVAVIIDESETTSIADTVLVYANGRLIEKLIAYYQADIDRYRFNGTIYHFNELDELSFKYISDSGDTINLIDRIDFESGVNKGTAYDPIKLSNTLLSAPSFTEFLIDGQLFETVISSNSILIRMPQDLELDSLVPTFEVAGHAIPMITDSVQYSAISAVDFTFPVSYRLYSHDRSSYVDYLVKVVYFFQDITASVWIDQAETISETDTLYAFVDGVFSGYTTPTYVPEIDRFRFEITAVYTADTGLVSFEFYHTLTNSTYDLVANQVFQDSVLNGTLFNPVVLSNELIPTAELLSFEVPNQFGSTLFTAGDTVIVRLDPIYDYANSIPTFETTPAAISLVEDSAYYSNFTVMDLSNPIAFDVYNHTKDVVRNYQVKAVYHKHTLVASVLIDELEQQSQNDTLFAFIDGVLSAFATPTYVADIDRYRFELDVLHYFEAGEITFSYFQASTGNSYSLIQNQSFVAGESSGTLFNPIVLSNVNLPDAAFLSFTLENQFGATYMEDQQIIIKLDPLTNDYSDLVPSFTVTPGSIVEVEDSVQYANFTRGDFSQPVTYSVYNFDRSIHSIYTVSVVYYTVEGTFRAFVNNEELNTPTDVIYAQIDGEEMTSTNYVSDNWNEFRFEIEMVHYFSTGEVVFGYKDANEVFIAFPQTAFFEEGSVIGTDDEPFLLHNPIIQSCSLISFNLPNLLTPVILSQEDIILITEQTDDLSSLSATFETSLGANLYFNGNSIMYSDLSVHNFAEGSFIDLVCPNETTTRFEIKIQTDDFENFAASSLVSPNGDGINDTWKVNEVEKFHKSIFKIFDNHGRLVFESVGYDNSWDGKYDGNNLPVGSYYYTVESPDGTVNKGVISLLYD